MFHITIRLYKVPAEVGTNGRSSCRGSTEQGSIGSTSIRRILNSGWENEACQSLLQTIEHEAFDSAAEQLGSRHLATRSGIYSREFVNASTWAAIVPNSYMR